jgi:catechol 2,3-dioxygenase-like lactoylglutathione lyase family enzyme
MSTFRFDCVFYVVSDLARSISFYETVLGLQLSSRDDVARFHVDGVLFELVPTDNPALFTGSGNARLTLDVDDIESTMQDLRAKGIRTSEIRTVSNGRVGALFDPDGNEVCLWQYT